MNDAKDEKIRQEIQHELRWMPPVDPGQLGVAVKAGAVTLTGTVNDGTTRQAVEQLARRVLGVQSVANEIQIRRADDARRDAGLVRAVAEAFGKGRTPLG
jgi:osmotically-inducible protein OsmY